MQRRNVIGPLVAKMRFERDWTQEMMAARLQTEGVDVSRQMLANLEAGRTQITDKHLIGFQKIFRTRLVRLFPLAVQELDERFAKRESTRPLKRHHRRKP